MRKRGLWILGLSVGCALLVVSFIVASFTGIPESANAFHRATRYEITVVNMTRGQIMSPPVVAIHHGRMEPLFSVGSPASEGVTAIAEDAVNDTLLAALEDSPDVQDFGVITGAMGPIMPGETASIELEGGSFARRVSLVGMLVTTNDAFYGLTGVRAPFFGSDTHRTPAYDSGTEENNEDCDFIPGPPCGNPGVRATENAEGYVHIHAGVHGEGDLVPADHDWRNPVAQVTIRRVR